MVTSAQGYFFNPFALPMILAALAVIALGLTTLWYGRHSRPSQLFFCFTLSLALYNGCFGLAYLSSDAKTALYWVRLAYIGVPLIPVMLLTYIGSLKENSTTFRIILVIGWGLALSFVLAALGTNWLIAGVEKFWWGYYKHYGILGLPFLAYVVAYGAFCGIFYRRLLNDTTLGSNARMRLKLHLRSLLVGSLIAVDFLAGFGWPIYPFGYLPTMILVAMLLVAMRRYGPVFFTPALPANTVLETMSEALLVVDEDYVVRKANRAAEALFQRSRRDLLGCPLQELLPNAPFQNNVLQQTHQESKLNFELEITDNSLEASFLHVSYNSLENSRGKPLAAMFLLSDVSRERQAQLALKRVEEEEERFRSTFEQAPIGAAMVSLDQQFLRVNDALCRITGYSAGELTAMKHTDIIHPDFLNPGPDEPEKLAAENATQGSADKRYIRKDGGEAWVRTSVRLVKDARNQPLYLLHIMEDITESKRAEKEKAELEEQLRHSQKMQAVGTLAGGIAHEFNNLLGIVMGFSELARDLAREKLDNSEEIDQIIQAADRGTSLVRQILTFSRKTDTDKKPLNLNNLVIHATKMMAKTFPKNIRIENHLSPELPLVEADTMQIEQVLINLCTNAQDAMPDGGRLGISTERVYLSNTFCPVCSKNFSGDYVLLKLSDNGEGMDKSTLEQIFEPFFSTKEVGKGTGLGLSVVLGLVRGNGGHINCESEPGKGSAFKVYLPVYREDLVPAEREQASQPQAGAAGTETILLVDDEESLRILGERYLKKAGYRVITAASGEEALEIYRARARGIALIVLDLGMPGMGGHQCMKEITAFDPQARIIVASGYTGDAQVRESLNIGASAFVSKPYKQADLLSAIKGVMQSGPGET